MKDLFFNLLLFVVLSLAFSSLTGCTGSANSQNGPAVNGPEPAASVAEVKPVQEPKKPSDYPPIATAVAQADIKNLDGTTFKVADRKGKVILLNLWATWCGPCRSEMPALVRMQDRHRDKGLEIIGLDADDESVEDINAFAASMNLNYQLVWASTTLQKDLLNISKFDGIPQSFLIDRDGNLRGVFRGANASDVKKMEDLVAKVVNDDGVDPTSAATGAQPAN